MRPDARGRAAPALSRFTEKLGYSDRDIGIKADGSIGGRFTYMATLTNGTGTAGADENSGKSLAGRVTLLLMDGLQLAGNVSRHDFVRGDGETDAATAFGADLEFGGFRSGTHLQVGVIGGGNWRHEAATAAEIPGFLTWQAILSRYVPVDGQGFEAIEPVARASWGDPNRDAEDDTGLLVTPRSIPVREGQEPDRLEPGRLPAGVRGHRVFLQAADLSLLLTLRAPGCCYTVVTAM